jgi:hypothetical protein
MHFDGIRQETFKDAVEKSIDATDATIFKSSFLASLMADGWDGLLWGKAIKLLLAFSLITTSYSGLISMHPLVHLWSRERISASEHADTRKCVMMTLEISMRPCNLPDGRQQRRLLLPHIVSLLEHGNGELLASFPKDLEESTAMLAFHWAYAEGGQFRKASQLHS